MYALERLFEGTTCEFCGGSLINTSDRGVLENEWSAFSGDLPIICWDKMPYAERYSKILEREGSWESRFYRGGLKLSGFAYSML